MKPAMPSASWSTHTYGYWPGSVNVSTNSRTERHRVRLGQRRVDPPYGIAGLDHEVLREVAVDRDVRIVRDIHRYGPERATPRLRLARRLLLRGLGAGGGLTDP